MRSPLQYLKISCLKWDRSFYPPSVNSAFCFVATRRTRRSANEAQPIFAKRNEINSADASRIRWRRMVNVNETIKMVSLVSGAPEHLKLVMASRRAALSGGTF